MSVHCTERHYYSCVAFQKVYCSLFIQMQLSVCSSKKSLHTPFHHMRGQMLLHAVTNRNVNQVEACAFFCDKDSNCNTFSYHGQTHECSLSPAFPVIGNNAVNNVSFAVYIKGKLNRHRSIIKGTFEKCVNITVYSK